MFNIITKINVTWLIFTVSVCIVLLKLGFWQSERAIEKDQRLAKIELLKRTSPLNIDDILTYPHDEINDLPVSIVGTFNESALFFLDNQPNNGKLGYRVFQVVRYQKYHVLVNLGWVMGSINRNELPDVKAIEGEFVFTGNVRIVEQGIVLAEQDFSNVTWPLRVQQIDLGKFSQIINKELLPFVVYLDKKEVLGYEKNWQPIVMSPDKHRGYAFQWFSLALAWVVLMILALAKSKRNVSK